MKQEYFNEELYVEEGFKGSVIEIGISDYHNSNLTCLTLEQLIKLKEYLDIIIANETT